MNPLPQRTKIVCTLGPASEDAATLRAMIRAGMSVARINMSHGTTAEHSARLATLRKVAEAEGAVVAVLQDLQGPRLRLGEVAEGTVLTEGQTLTLDGHSAVGDARRMKVSYARPLAENVQRGQRILIDDGRIVLRVVGSGVEDIETEVVEGGPVSSHKGVNLPETPLAILSPTPKDLQDVQFGLAEDVDFIALSFVSDAAQVRALQQFIRDSGGDIPVIAKIERPDAVRNLAAIVAQSDGVMVARGDLALEIGAARVPVEQKRIIQMANEAAIPVITATQMLDSMIHSTLPTRAEANDVANAIYDGTDAVMLSAETAMGDHPAEVVAMMAAIAREVERVLPYEDLGRRGAVGRKHTVDGAICEAAVDIARRVNVAAIIAGTSSGSTPRAVAAHRPEMPLIGAAHQEQVARRMALVWGVTPLIVAPYATTDEMVRALIETTAKAGLIGADDRVVITSGQPIGRSGTTSMVQVRFAGDYLMLDVATRDVPAAAGRTKR